MALQSVLVHVDDVTPENMKKGEGWAISEFRLPITGRHGSSTTLFHSIFRPGSTHAKHLHAKCDEIAVYLKGHGVVGQSSERTEVRAGHCRLMPKGSEHFFSNEWPNFSIGRPHADSWMQLFYTGLRHTTSKILI